jgi:hypothetical protein
MEAEQIKVVNAAETVCDKPSEVRPTTSNA